MIDSKLPKNYLLQNRYSILKSLGQGGFGITYQAYDQQLDQEVCIKELFIAGNCIRSNDMSVHSDVNRDFTFAEFTSRFLTEAKQLAKFRHPNIVRVIDVFESNNTAYMVMEYIEGVTLKEKVNKEGTLSEEASVTIVSQLLDAVEEVHKNGLLHRDIKPDNVLITAQMNVMLIDFGSARAFTEGKTVTQTAMISPGYAPLEQYSNRSQRGTYTDIYALGATMYFLLTGEKPIPSTDRHIEELSAPHQLNTTLSSQLSSAVMLAMELKPEDRFQNVNELREALQLVKEEHSRSHRDIAKSTVANSKSKPKTRSLRLKILRLPLVLIVAIPIIILIVTYAQAIIKDKHDPLVVSQQEQIHFTTLMGNQRWTRQNLNVNKFRNGDIIPQAVSNEEWNIAAENKMPAWCYYGNNDRKGEKYGKLYNWYAVNDPRGLAPDGFRIPTNSDVHTLDSIMRSSTINYNFHAEMAGSRKLELINYSFVGESSYGVWWTATETNSDYAYIFYITSRNELYNNQPYDKGRGFSVRCIKD